MERTIRVTGKGTITIKPDTIQLNISSEGICKQYADALEQAAQNTRLLRESISQAGLDPNGLKTTDFSVDMAYERYQDRNSNWKKRFLGYKFSEELYLCFGNDNELLGKVLYYLSKCRADAEFSISYFVKDTEPDRVELLAAAVADSKKKALILTEAAGVKLGEVENIDYSWQRLDVYTNKMRISKDESLARFQGIGGSLDIDMEADDIHLEDTVTVIWRIS
ncbi:MAG: SIMPL domain-containing protein [Solobacterium sp.]|nr:SIMPL domain-containing protein [Solobacterium sp.]